MTTTTNSFVFLDADLHITSSDGIAYHVHKHRMSISPVFADMFSLPTPEDDTQVHNDSDDKAKLLGTSVELTESSETLEQLLHFIYDTDMVKPGSMLLFNSSKRYMSPLDEYQRLAALFEAACKYEVEPAQRTVVDALQCV
jgi:hypothetical protein